MRILVSTVAFLLVLLPSPAGASAPLDLRTRWSCDPAFVWVDPSAPAEVHDAARVWRDAFRPDWGFTDRLEAAAVEVWMRHPSSPDAAGTASIFGDATRRYRAVVEIDPASPVPGRVALHEFGHVAGLEHTIAKGSAMSPRSLGSYGPADLVWLARAGRACL